MVWLWFSSGELSSELRERRFRLLQTGLGALVGPFVSRIIQHASPIYRDRPLHTPDLNFVLPFGVTSDQLHEWSSFPSDNAALAFALAMGMWRVSRPLGWLCFAWALFVVGLPRVYAGYHYPGDIAGGALVGILSMLALGKLMENSTVMQAVTTLQRRLPGLFYSACFVCLFYITTQFEDLRKIGSRFLEMVL
jgi:undecaprenyl-diphosphatase